MIKCGSGKGQDTAAVHRAMLYEVIITGRQEREHDQGSALTWYRHFFNFMHILLSSWKLNCSDGIKNSFPQPFFVSTFSKEVKSKDRDYNT